MDSFWKCLRVWIRNCYFCETEIGTLHLVLCICSLFNNAGSKQDYTASCDWMIIINWKRRGRKRTWLTSKYSLYICLGRLIKTTKYFRIADVLSWDSNWTPPEYKSVELPLWPTLLSFWKWLLEQLKYLLEFAFLPFINTVALYRGTL
jgi:hypothetical protein